MTYKTICCDTYVAI